MKNSQFISLLLLILFFIPLISHIFNNQEFNTLSLVHNGKADSTDSEMSWSSRNNSSGQNESSFPDLIIENSQWDIRWLNILDDEYKKLEYNHGSYQFDFKRKQVYSITISIANIGYLNVDNVSIRFNITDFTTFNTYTYWEQIDTIAAGKNDTVSFIFIPLEYGTDYLPTFYVDPDDNITELNENNNEWDLYADNAVFFHSKYAGHPPEVNEFTIYLLIIAVIFIVVATIFFIICICRHTF